MVVNPSGLRQPLKKGSVREKRKEFLTQSLGHAQKAQDLSHFGIKVAGRRANKKPAAMSNRVLLPSDVLPEHYDLTLEPDVETRVAMSFFCWYVPLVFGKLCFRPGPGLLA